jgi:hypothetical protein
MKKLNSKKQNQQILGYYSVLDEWIHFIDLISPLTPIFLKSSTMQDYLLKMIRDCKQKYSI